MYKGSSKWIAPCTVLLASLTGCGRRAVTGRRGEGSHEPVVPVARCLGATQAVKLQVGDLKCETAGEVFKCQVLGKTNGQQWQDGYHFIRLGVNGGDAHRTVVIIALTVAMVGSPIVGGG